MGNKKKKSHDGFALFGGHGGGRIGAKICFFFFGGGGGGEDFFGNTLCFLGLGFLGF